LSVIAAAAEGATRAASDDVVVVARAAASAAAEALARTPQQLPVLARAGVVDAGGQGLCLLLDSLVEALSGGAAVPVRDRPAAIVPFSPRVGADAPVREAGSSAYGYEVQYLLDADPAAVDLLKGQLAALGDSLVVVGTGSGDPPTWNVHVHVNDVGAAIEAGVVAGRPYRITVTRFADQVAAAPGSHAGGPAVDPHARAAVVMAAGDGLAGLFAAEGATVVGGNPSTAELLEGIRSTGAGLVVLLPSDSNTHAVAATAAREACAAGVRVSVVPTRSPVQALAALAVRDTGRAFSDDLISMAEAAGACRYGEVCYARREALTVAGPCRPGDVLGLVDGEVHLIGADLAQLSADLLDRMLGGGGELVTLLVGAGAPAGLGETLRAHVAQAWPFVEVHAYDGGQPFYPLLLGVE
ncbi:MAG TPA: DAK2 domain-containing protein, partial [Catenuloplanes sp.]